MAATLPISSAIGGRGAFRSLRIRNYRLWAAGALISNVGTWMQRTAQDWLVLAELTHRSASAVGVVTALQFAPQLLLLPWTGSAADRFDRRRLLFVTQAAMGLLAFGLGLLALSGAARLWHVDVFAFLLGCATAFDAPVRQTFVAELVGDTDLSNAVGLNSTSFNAARTIGPAVAGVLIAEVGTGIVFLINAASFLFVLASLAALRVGELHRKARVAGPPGQLPEALRYVAGRPDLVAILTMLFLVGTFGLNFAIFISTMSVTVFHAGAREYGLLTSSMAIGSVIGALLAAWRERPRFGFLVAGAGFFALGLGLAAVMPNYRLFGIALVLVGISAQTVTTSAIGLVQLSTDPALRGRVIAILLAITLGALPLGSPLIGWVADRFGPRAAIDLGALGAAAATLIGLRYMFVARRAARAHDGLSIRQPS
jgi:MFS family permease